jgi:hypothetical protein
MNENFAHETSHSHAHHPTAYTGAHQGSQPSVDEELRRLLDAIVDFRGRVCAIAETFLQYEPPDATYLRDRVRRPVDEELAPALAAFESVPLHAAIVRETGIRKVYDNMIRVLGHAERRERELEAIRCVGEHTSTLAYIRLCIR